MKSKNSFDPYPAWADAHLAIKYVEKEKARGSTAGLWVRELSQRRLGQFGRFAGKSSGIVLFFGTVLLGLLCIGIQQIRLDTTLDSLWTSDSGRLQRELNYVNAVSGLSPDTNDMLIPDTNEMLIQTPKVGSDLSILNTKALLEHLNVLQKALAVTVELFDVTWSLKDLCYSPNIPPFDVQFIDNIFEKIFPCVIVTPLDCFWEGSKLLGPEYAIQIPGFPGVKWTNLNPRDLLDKAKFHQANDGFTFGILEGFMKRAGIGTGYMEKPCLNPLDPECPVTAPNKKSTKPLDIASILAQGCYGFAPRFMHWAPDLIVGGQVFNKSGNLIRAGGLMSTVNLMSSINFYDYSKEIWKTKHIDPWNEAKAQDVLSKWQSRFAAEVSHMTYNEKVKPTEHVRFDESHFNFYTFTPAGLDSVVESASQFSWVWGGIRTAGVSLACMIVGVCFSGSKQSWRIRLGLLFGGALIAILGTAAGCGLVGFINVPFNVATVQVLPYLTLALVTQVVYLLLYAQLNSGYDAKATLKRHGFSLLLGILVSGIFIVSGGFFPIPAVRSIAFQSAIFVTISSLAILIMFPALCQLVLRQRKSCISIIRQPHNNRVTGESYFIGPYLPTAPFSAASNKIGMHAPQQEHIGASSTVPLVPIGRSSGQIGIGNSMPPEVQTDTDGEIGEFGGNDTTTTAKPSLSRMNWIELYILVMNKKWFKAAVAIIYIVWIVVSCVGIAKLRLGLPITNVVPSNSSEWEFLTAQNRLFSVFNMRAITKANFDYPNNQKLLHQFHDTMSGLPWVIRDDNGGKPAMWLTVFRSWLVQLQDAFDREWRLGYLHKESWTKDASSDGILAWKLAAQTGHVDHPVDLTQLPNNRLVSSEGIINPRGFYVYLTAWASNDPLAYGLTAAAMQPVPREWIHLPDDDDLKIPKSAPIKFAEIPYIIRTNSDGINIESDQETQILAFVREIRAICSSFESRGLPVFPWGIPFRFYEQYLDLPFNAAIVIGVAVGSTMLITFLSLGFSLRNVGLVVSVIIITMLQMGGIIGSLKVGLNALPVEIALLGVSLITFCTIQIVVAFCCVPGPIENRRSLAFAMVGPPCVQSLVLISVAALILYSPDFTFIFTHFTLLVSISAVFSLLNLVLLLPLLLGIFQPPCWLEGTYSDDPTFLLPLTPSPTPKRPSNNYCHNENNNRYATCGGRNSVRSSRSGSNGRRSAPPPYSSRTSLNGGSSKSHKCSHNRAPSENSLSTITEEPNSCATRRSADIVVQPQVVVETFDGGDCTTKTKVSAKLKVEVHSSTNSNGHHNSSSSTVYNSSNSSNPQSSMVTSSNGSDNSGTSASTSSSGSFTSSSTSSQSSYHDRCTTED